jgi:hypothetical protein
LAGHGWRGFCRTHRTVLTEELTGDPQQWRADLLNGFRGWCLYGLGHGDRGASAAQTAENQKQKIVIVLLQKLMIMSVLKFAIIEI